MSRMRWDQTVFRDPAWWHWSVTSVLLAGYFAGFRGCLMVAIGLCVAVAGFDVLIRRNSAGAMGVQIRLGYALLLAVGMAPGLGWIHVVQLAGVLARVAVGYCLLERLLMLMPWNRPAMASRVGVAEVLLQRPGSGGLWRMREAVLPSACSLRAGPGRNSATTLAVDQWKENSLSSGGANGDDHHC